MFPEDNPGLRALLPHHDVVLDVTDDLFKAQQNDLDSVLMSLLRAEDFLVKAQAGSLTDVSALLMAEAAGALVVLEKPVAECELLSRQSGVCTVALQAPQSIRNLTQKLASKEILHNTLYKTVVNGQIRVGWYSLLTATPLPLNQVPINALVLEDNYLFGDKGTAKDFQEGQQNLISLLDALLPAALAVDFHLLMLVNNEKAFLRDQNLNQLFQAVREALARPYKLKIGVLTRKGGGKRRRALVSNNYFGASHHGFCTFDLTGKALLNNDLNVEGLFNGVTEQGFDLPWQSMRNELLAARAQMAHNLALQNLPNGYVDPIHLVVGHRDNRLLKLVE